jgi:NADH-quinone oxidoreductase subunit M
LLCAGLVLHQSGAADTYAFVFLILAAILRTGLFPFHGLVVSRFENGPLLPAGLLLNAQLGAFLAVRWAIPLFPEIAQSVVPWLGMLALVSTIGTAILGTVEKEPRRLLALIFVSQSSAILAGLVTARPEGTMGGLVQWIVLGVASTVMIAICRAIEVRIDQPLAGEGLLGLTAHMPRLAVFFAVSALSIVGLPGTLGFPGEDLLIHGVLSAYPILGILLPAAIAINAYHAYKLFSRLFLGAPVTAWSGTSDALPRERWAFSVCLAILVFGGLLPSKVVSLRFTAADLLATVAGAPAMSENLPNKGAARGVVAATAVANRTSK